MGWLWAGVRTSVPRAVVAAAPTGFPAWQSLGVTPMVPCMVAQRDVVEVPNVSPRSAPPTEEMCEFTSWPVPECCYLLRPTLVRVGENQGNIMRKGGRCTYICSSLCSSFGAPGPPRPLLLLSSSPILLMLIKARVDTSLRLVLRRVHLGL